MAVHIRQPSSVTPLGGMLETPVSHGTHGDGATNDRTALNDFITSIAGTRVANFTAPHTSYLVSGGTITWPREHIDGLTGALGPGGDELHMEGIAFVEPGYTLDTTKFQLDGLITGNNDFGLAVKKTHTSTENGWVISANVDRTSAGQTVAVYGRGVAYHENAGVWGCNFGAIAKVSGAVVTGALVGASVLVAGGIGHGLRIASGGTQPTLGIACEIAGDTPCPWTTGIQVTNHLSGALFTASNMDCTSGFTFTGKFSTYSLKTELFLIGPAVANGYDNYLQLETGGAGRTTIRAIGTTTGGLSAATNAEIRLQGLGTSGIELRAGSTVAFGCSNDGAGNPKLAFYNGTQRVRPAHADQAAVTTTVGAAVGTTAATNTTPFGYTTQAQADDLVARVNQLRADVIAINTLLTAIRNALIPGGIGINLIKGSA